MAQGLTEYQRELLIELQSRLSRTTAFLQEMSSTAHLTSWLIDDALWENYPPERPRVEDELEFHLHQVHMLLRDSLGLLEMFERYSDADDPQREYQHAFNALANAGMLPPQQEPPAHAAEPCADQEYGHRNCVGPCDNTKLPPGS